MDILGSIGVHIGVSEFIVNLIVSVLVFIVGIAVGRIASFALKRALDNARIEKAKGYSFLKRFITVLELSIDVLFLSLALRILGIPNFTNWLTNILIVIPALVGGLLLIALGFMIASYIKEAIDESRLDERETLGKMFYFFVLYIFMAFALKTALISFDSMVSNIIIIILTAIVAVSVAYTQVRSYGSRKK